MWQMLGREINIIHAAHQNEIDTTLAHISSMSGIQHAHLPYRDDYCRLLRSSVEDARKYVICFVCRHPLGVVLSHVHWMERGGINSGSWCHLPDDVLEKGVREYWLGGKGRAWFELYSQWLDVDFIHLFRYEYLVNGFKREATRLSRIIDGEDHYSSIKMHGRVIKRRKDSPAFRKGLVGEWRHRFTGVLLDDLIVELGPSIERYGYTI